jgi:oligopeptide transport system substrate-binding protein
LRAEAPAVFRHGWGADFPDPDKIAKIFTSYSGNKFTQWKSKDYDALIEKAAAERSPAKRVKLYDKAQKLLTEEAVAIVPLFQESINLLVAPKVKGLRINALGLLNISGVEIK